MKSKRQSMDIKIVLKNEFKEIDDTTTMAQILRTIADDLDDGLLNNHYYNYEWYYIYKDI